MNFLHFFPRLLAFSSTVATDTTYGNDYAFSDDDGIVLVVLITLFCILVGALSSATRREQRIAAENARIEARKQRLNAFMGQSRAEVAKALGAPNRTVSLGADGEIWVFENYQTYVGGSTGDSYTYPILDSYLEITFDTAGNATSWTDQKKPY